jgi:hypothetical protein
MSSHLMMVTRWPPSSADQDQAIYGWSTKTPMASAPAAAMTAAVSRRVHVRFLNWFPLQVSTPGGAGHAEAGPVAPGRARTHLARRHVTGRSALPGPGSTSRPRTSPGGHHRDTELLQRARRRAAERDSGCRGGHGRRGGVPGRLTGQRRLARAVEDDVVRFRLPALLPFDFEPGGVHRSNQAEVVSF